MTDSPTSKTQLVQDDLSEQSRKSETRYPRMAPQVAPQVAPPMAQPKAAQKKRNKATCAKREKPLGPKSPRVRVDVDPTIYADFKLECEKKKVTVIDAVNALITKVEFPPPRITLVELPAREDVAFSRSVRSCALLMYQMATAITRIESFGVNDASVLNDIRTALGDIADDLKRSRAQ